MPTSPLNVLRARVGEALVRAFGPDVAAPEPLVVATRDPRHGDYSCPAPLALARPLRQAPLALAERLAGALDVADVCLPPEVVAPGFVNLRLRPAWLAARVAAAVGDERVGSEPAPRPRHVVVDYSGPNMAKEMHVGHLRSTIIGHCLANVAELAGHHVERVSHVGDWGTQFGMLVAHLEDVGPGVVGGDAEVHFGDLADHYQAAKARFDADAAFRGRARLRVVDLQAGERSARAAWEALLALSRRDNQEVYDLLGVEGLVERGESSYQPLLATIVADLQAAGLAVVDDGATCVFVDGFTNTQGDPLPLIVRKADGGYTYATTDLAALRQRVEQGAQELLYVADAGQSQHFQMVFAVAGRMGWLPQGVDATHVAFGLVLGEDGRRLRTRAGDTVPLRDLLHTAVDRARTFVVARAAERGQGPPADLDHVARVVGIGAVTYADLSQNRQSDYVFSYDKMLTLRGNTAPYLQYAYARVRSILREAGCADGPPAAAVEAGVELVAPQEVDLARRLVEVGDVLDRVAVERAPSQLCAWLHELAQAFNQFYEHCPVLRADEAVRHSRLVLCAATAAALRLGLRLLGIEVLERI